MKANVLVVANRTATSNDLLAALRERADRSPSRFELLVPPASPGPVAREAARAVADAAVAAYAEEGLEAEGRVGCDPDPVISVLDAYDRSRHDEIVVSTLPEEMSHWLRIDGPARIARATGALVRHVVAREPRPAPQGVPVERPRGVGVLGPLLQVGFGRPPRET